MHCVWRPVISVQDDSPWQYSKLLIINHVGTCVWNRNLSTLCTSPHWHDTFLLTLISPLLWFHVLCGGIIYTYIECRVDLFVQAEGNSLKSFMNQLSSHLSNCYMPNIVFICKLLRLLFRGLHRMDQPVKNPISPPDICDIFFPRLLVNQISVMPSSIRVLKSWKQ
jgi:hypothetical protein